jgi:hypothetical protein
MTELGKQQGGKVESFPIPPQPRQPKNAAEEELWARLRLVRDVGSHLIGVIALLPGSTGKDKARSAIETALTPLIEPINGR